MTQLSKEIRDNIDSRVSEAAKIASETKNPPTPGDIEELKELMQRFLKDVDFEYESNKAH